MNEAEIRKVVRERYGDIVARNGSCCGSSAQSCCGNKESDSRHIERSREIGYSDQELSSIPEGSNLGLGCGNPTAIASIVQGEAVLDLGSGAGFDCFLAAQKTGPTGKVIGVDMTPQMVERAREHAERGSHGNVEFRLGEIEHLPVADGTVDVAISNCVINLSTDKQQVFHEVYRVLKPGGRIMVSDIVLLKDLPEEIKRSVEAYAGCIAGALLKDDYLQKILDAGFVDVKIQNERAVDLELEDLDADSERGAAAIASVDVYAVKPAI